MRNLYTGTIEYLVVTVRTDVMLDAQAVSISWDNTTYYAAEWIGTPAACRQARLLVSASNFPPLGQQTVYVKVDDGTEIPIMNAGKVVVH